MLRRLRECLKYETTIRKKSIDLEALEIGKAKKLLRRRKSDFEKNMELEVYLLRVKRVLS